MSNEIRPFSISIPQSEVARLFRKLRDTRIPESDIVPGAGTSYGFTTEWATDLYNFWVTKYSWDDAQRQMTRWPHYTTELEGMTVHFVHQRSKSPHAFPILLVHGWPGSFYEFSQVIDPLSDEYADVSFHCVVPSLPGFCGSSGPPKGWTLQDTARIFHALMLRLGYHEYVVQAGDWGHWVGRELGARYSDACRAIHFNYAPGVLPPGTELTEREKGVQDRRKDWLENHLGYAVLMRTRPHTIGWMMQDNPVAIMVWIGEKYNELAHPEKQKANAWKTHILTTVSLYYLSNCSMTASLVYYENVRHEKFAEFAAHPDNRIVAPFGYTSFFWDSAPSSGRAVAQTGNMVFFRERNDGGHFACLEGPMDVVEDVRELVKEVMNGQGRERKHTLS